MFGTSSSSDDRRKPKKFSTASDTSSDDSDSGGEEDLCMLKESYPTLSQRDCARFKESFQSDDGSDEDVIAKLDEYVQFRTMYNLDSPQNKDENCSDEADWEWASTMAIKAAKTVQGDLIPGLEGLALADRVCKLDKLPRLCFTHTNEDGTPVLSRSGNPMIQYLAARLDLKAFSEEIYALAIALYLDRKARKLNFDAKRVVLLVDVRKGAGWPNSNVLNVVGFLRLLANALHKLHPGRLQKLIIYPVPCACVYVFAMMKRWLPTSIAQSITLINGPDGVRDKPPKKKLMKYIDERVLDKMEQCRKANFSE